MLSKRSSGAGNAGGRRLWRKLVGLGAVIGIGAGSMLVGLGVSATVPEAAASGDPSCTFSANGQSGTGDESQPFLLTGLTSSSSVSVTCTGLPAGETMATVQASPLAVVTQPFSLTLLGSEADMSSASLGSASAGGVYTTSAHLGTTGAGTFSGGGTFPNTTTSFVSDPNAQCPPTQAQINAGLMTCVIAVADVTKTTATNATASQADFAGLALLDFNGQAKPQVPPTVSFNPPLVAAGHAATVTDAGSATSWWAGGWWAGGYPDNGLIAGPYTIPASNVLVNGKQASSSSVQVSPAVYCFYGGTASSCNSGTADTPGAGQLFPAQLGGSVAIPSTASGSAAISIYEPNNWGTAFPGNNTNSAFPSSDLTATGNVPITDVGYWEVASDGGIFPFGTANFMGSMGGKPLDKPVVGMAATPDGGGYWEVASDGGIFAFGNAQFYGSMGGKPLNWPIVGIAPTSDGGGYWEVASDGGVFAFGDAQFYGSMGGKPLDKPIVGIAAVPGGGGYWEVASDGGVFAFGDAQFYGSMGGKPLDKTVVGIAVTPDGGGYWEVAADGGIFSFGDTTFFGSMGGMKLNKPVVGMWSASKGNGYWEVASDGGIFNFSSAAPFLGSMAGTKLNGPVVGGTLVPVPPTSSLTVSTTTTSSGYGAAGQTIPYSYLVTNSGATTLTNIAVTDDKNSVSCPSGTLTKGSSETCTGTYTVTQADVDGGSLTSSATAAGTTPSGTTVSSSLSAVTLLANSATTSMTMTKSSTESSFAEAGDLIHYQYTVTNTGTTTLSDIAVTDSATNPFDLSLVPPTAPTSVTVSCPSTTLAPGADEMCHSTYTVTQDDVDSGQAQTTPPTGSDPAGTPWVQNSATASAENPAGATVGPTAVQTVYVYDTDAATDGAISITKSSTSTFTGADEVLSYTYLVTNTGPLTLNGVGVTDEVSVPGDVTVTCPISPSANFVPGQSETCMGSYTTTSTDVSNGEVTNVATATGYDLDFGNGYSDSDSKTLPLTP